VGCFWTAKLATPCRYWQRSPAKERFAYSTLQSFNAVSDQSNQLVSGDAMKFLATLLFATLPFLSQAESTTIAGIDDEYGNIDTALTQQDLDRLGVRMGDRIRVSHKDMAVVMPLGKSYEDVDRGEWIALLNSAGQLRLARSFENAAENLGVADGDELTLTKIVATVEGKIEKIDGEYGNVETTLQQGDLDRLDVNPGDKLLLTHNTKALTVHFGESYADVGEGEWVSFLNWEGKLRFARNLANAATTLDASAGDGITIGKADD
jgi:S-adenosylmethionine hydrolase